MPVTLSDTSARIAAIVLEQYLEDRHRELQHFTRMSALLGSSEPRAIDERTRRAIEIVLGELRAGATDRIVARWRAIADLLRAVRTPRTVEELQLQFDAEPEQLTETLLGLEELGHVQQLEDGHHVIRWEITEAGEREL